MKRQVPATILLLNEACNPLEFFEPAVQTARRVFSFLKEISSKK
jgi:hypothetical protein